MIIWGGAGLVVVACVEEFEAPDLGPKPCANELFLGVEKVSRRWKRRAGTLSPGSLNSSANSPV